MSKSRKSIKTEVHLAADPTFPFPQCGAEWDIDFEVTQKVSCVTCDKCKKLSKEK